MNITQKVTQFSMKWPKLVTSVMIIITILLGFMITRVKVDTDPENMLSEDEAVRIFHSATKTRFDLFDVIVLGIVNESHPDGVFNPATLKKIDELTEFSYTLTWPDPDDPSKTAGVVKRNVIAPDNIDTIEQAGPGQVRFKWLMKKAPVDSEGAYRIREKAMSNPLLRGTLVSEDGKALCIYLPITRKDFAYRVQAKLKDKIAGFKGDEKFHITGLPVAEDTFGVEMFIQMAVSAPLAMIAIFILMLIFFKKIQLIISPMILAMVSVICTMGLLIGTGNTLHIMSSMIPIFLMPIAVVDSIHILSEFFDRYQTIGDRKKTLEHVMDDLFVPMLFTSLTTAAGFASLALTPIPPVQVFGIFVAFGVLFAWALTVTFIPAYITMLNEKSIETLGMTGDRKPRENDSFISKRLRWLGRATYTYSKPIIAITVIVLILAGYGISKIEINDNPVKWFKHNHPIRIADEVLNRHFGGTYEAYLTLGEGDTHESVATVSEGIKKGIREKFTGGAQEAGVADEALRMVDIAASESTTPDVLIRSLSEKWEVKLDGADDETYDAWTDALDVLDVVKGRHQIFKEPVVLRYLDSLQKYLLKIGVGKSNSAADIVKKVHQELFESKKEYYRIPDTRPAIAQSYLSFQSSHRPDFLWHFVTPDYRKANIWIQLKSGDNKDMEKVVSAVEEFFRESPPPIPLTHGWAGLTYLNVIWQEKMVWGMLKSLLGSFVVVLILMTALFRSPLWGIIAMIPLSVTIAVIYGIIGFIGKDYDMPVAVLSSLTLGMAVDFAIHFLQRSQHTFRKTGSWERASEIMFEEPARAITRNVIVIAIGFTPLLAAPLVPYITVGFFLASIMAISGIGTMIILPSLVRILEKPMFKKIK